MRSSQASRPYSQLFDYARRRNSFRLSASSRPPRHGDPRNSSGMEFKPTDTVRQTGIYEVMHDQNHRPAHDAVMLAGDVFPACDTCEDRVRFRLVRTAPYIFQDDDFPEEAK